jgi:hypothetical protein
MSGKPGRSGRKPGAHTKGETITKAVLRACADGQTRRINDVASEIGRDVIQVRNAARAACKYHLLTKLNVARAAYFRITNEGRQLIGVPAVARESVLGVDGKLDVLMSALMTRPALETVWGMA